MLGAGVYSVVSTSHKGWVLGPEVQAKATLIVRPVSGDSKKLVETWCYENEFFWPLFGGQSRPGGSASTYNVTSNTIKMASNTADCAGTGDPKVCTKMSAAAECASVGPNLLSTRYLLTYD